MDPAIRSDTTGWKRSGARSAALGCLTLFLTAICLAAPQEAESDKDKGYLARANPILRNYFRKEFLRAYRSDDPSRPEPNKVFLESFIDRRVDGFIDNVKKQVEEIDARLSEAEDASVQLAEASESGQKSQARRKLKKSLETLRDKISGLRGSLALLFLRLQGKSDDTRIVHREGEEEGYGDAVAAIAAEIAKAKDQIVHYLIEPTNTVSALDLRGETMLTRLHRAERLSKELEKRL